MEELPRVEAVATEGPSTLRIRWRGKRSFESVNLIGWIVTGGDILAPLRDPKVFARADVSAHGTAIAWDDDDLAIDALHLKRLADEQKPFDNKAVRNWQATVKLSNNEAADLLDVSVSTWNTYKADATVPHCVAMVMRASLRDPLLMQAHLRPRATGRPRKNVAN
jgi:hypothetical protein